MKKNRTDDISSELLAAILDGNVSKEETQQVLNNLTDNTELLELMRVLQQVDESLNQSSETINIIPMTAVAATCDEQNICCLECEKWILRKRNITFSEEELLQNAIQQKWLLPEGTRLHNVGRHLEQHGLVVTRRYNCSIADIQQALADGDDVIAVVDGGELTGNRQLEQIEDRYVGKNPDHSIVILSCNEEKNEIEVFNPDSAHRTDRYPLAQFLDAWDDSNNYLVTSNFQNAKPYQPHPIDLSDVELTDDILELREAIAENAHEIWAQNRQAEGWTYGPQRDDKLKQTPDMVPYSQLPDSEKEYDRELAMKTIKLLKKIGYDLVKR